MSQWSSLTRRAKTVESRLQTQIDQYSSLSQKINGDFLYDEENPLMAQHEDERSAKEIEDNLHELSECINSMKDYNSNNSSQMNEELIKRYHEIYYDFNTEYKNISLAISRKKDSIELFNSSKQRHANGGSSGTNDIPTLTSDSSFEKLLKERSVISQSMRAVNDVLGQAFDTRNILSSQRSTLAGANSGASGMTTTGASINKLMDGISRKKSNENMVIAVFIGVLLCFTIWWVFLR